MTFAAFVMIGERSTSRLASPKELLRFASVNLMGAEDVDEFGPGVFDATEHRLWRRLVDLAVAPQSDPLRSHARFVDRLDRRGLPHVRPPHAL